MKSCQCDLTHLSGEWWFNGYWDDCCKDTAIKSTDKLGSLIWSEHQSHSVTRLDQLTTT